MTAPNVYELQTAEGKPPIRVVDLGQQQQATEPVEPPAAGQWVEYGGAFSSSDEEHLRLNMSASELTAYLNDEQTRLNAARAKLEAELQRVAQYGRLDDASTFDAVRERDPNLFERLTAAERSAEKAARIVKTAAAAVERETSAAPMVLGGRDAQKAATLLPLLTVQVDRGSLAEIRDSFRVALANEDDAACYVFATLLPDRLKRAPATRDGVTERREDPRIAAELQTMVSKVKSNLTDDSLSGLRKRAQGLKNGAGIVAFDAGTRRRALEFAKSGDVRRDGM